MGERAKVHNKNSTSFRKGSHNVDSCSFRHTVFPLNTYPDTNLQNAGLNKTGSSPRQFPVYSRHMSVNNESDLASTSESARPKTHVSKPGHLVEHLGVERVDTLGQYYRLVCTKNDTQDERAYRSEGHSTAIVNYSGHLSVKNDSDLDRTSGDARPKNNVSEVGHPVEQTGMVPSDRFELCLGSAGANNDTQAKLDYYSGEQSTATTSGTYSRIEEEKTDFYQIEREANLQFMAQSDCLSKISKNMKVHINFLPKQYGIVIKGKRENVHQAYIMIKEIDKSLCNSCVDVLKQPAITCSGTVIKNEYIDSVERSCDVLLEREISYSSGKTEVTKRVSHNKIIWLASKDRVLVLERNRFDNVQASVRLVPFPHQQGGKMLERKNDMVMVGFPNRTGENQIHESELESIMMKLLREASEKGDQSIAIPLLPVANWTFDEYMRSSVNTSVHWLLDSSSSNSSLLKVVLLTESQEWFRSTEEFLEGRILERLKGSAILTMNPQIRLIKGHLDNTEADVLVNTTAFNLDLSNGEVSKAVLKTAGPGIQRECWQLYPKGINPDIIAVTSGYNLKCKQVFHVTIPMYSMGMDVENIQNIRKAMLNCLKQAEAYRFSSVAFPAIGTGKLGYPAETVLSEMFGSVQRFRVDFPFSTLKEVLFVIYPKDIDLCQKFERHEEKIKKEISETQAKPIQKCTVRIYITGQEDNVHKAREMLQPKTGDLLVTLDDVVTEVVPSVSSTTFSALSKLHKREFKMFEEDGVRINYNASRSDVVFHGKRGRVGHAVITVQCFVEGLLAMQTEKIRIDNLNEQMAINVLETWQTGKNSNCYIYDESVPIVTLFAISTSDIEKAKFDLSRSSVDTDFICKSLNEMKPSERDEEEMDTSEVGAVIHDKGTSFQTPAVKRKFSLSKDASDLDIYERGNLVVKVYKANILHIPVTAIVNPANRDLNHCGALSRTIAQEAGSSLLQECWDINRKRCPLPVSSVVYTNAGNLHFKYVLHAVGPSWKDYSHNSKDGLNKCCEDLKQTVVSCLEMADSLNLESVGMPAISSGSFKVPKEICVTQYADAILEFSGRNNMLHEIHIVDLNLDMINVIHETFSVMFREGKPSPFPYTITSKTSVETNTDKSRKDTLICRTENFKPTGRSRPAYGSNPSDTRTEIATYKSDGNKSVKAYDFESITQEDVPPKGEGLKNSTQPAVVDDCVICMDKVTDGKKLNCGHIFCKECIEGYFRVKKVCPTCGTVCGIITGDQPDGQMDICKRPTSVAGFEQYECIAITYCFENGIQTTDHPRPGTPYKGITRTAYLPDSMEGREICAMLIVAFQRRLIFTIGTSRTTGKESVITWNDIHHKTNPRPNTQFGYPDKTYLQRVREELEVKGVIAKDIDTKLIKNLEKYNFRHTVYARME